ncbi:MAG: hypothetical protein A3G33_01365 [Omnitrophica bacterium RIFCSPLOWO2_12_FULL_44_17]|uniref:Peptidase M10 metallopeptidase domain-containing protein n=1 Tax=Candidatus Danuiimicrobium aquiferis TaxID=1801832 RepID=A0A1G1L1M7_9BACT|nr:MAG: hypothetical protein A3B72_00595 [Omnitrophica bacterium RIFCSPHIGHO2_02_FULL_45_28]OGW99052.1 MAG: hypothetical protein A3G33_01365 [Omnitrophica bacterium RIFCSPLOWO2_12_FULL_44_17]
MRFNFCICRFFYIHALRLIIIPVLVFGYSLQSPLVYAVPSRELRVGVAVTREYQSNREWKPLFERRLAYASKIFQNEFQIKFKPAKYWDWNPSNENRDMTYLLEDLKSQFPLNRMDVDFVIGLSRLFEVKTPEEMKDVDVIGRTQIFAGYIILRNPKKTLYQIQEETVLVHEIAHLFGAVHTNESNTIMYPIVYRQIPTRFDMKNQDIIRLTRDMNFKEGQRSLDQKTAKLLINNYKQLMGYDKSFGFFYALGIFYLKLGYYDDAANAWKAAIEVEPDNPQVRYDLGVLYYKRGNSKQAMKELARAVQKFDHPSQRGSKISALKMLGAAYYEVGDSNAAYRSWTQVLVLDPADQEAKLNLTTLKLKQGQVDDAIQSFQKASANENSPQVLSNLGSAYFQKGDYTKAIEYLNQALELAPKQKTRDGRVNELENWQPSEIYKRLGYCYLKLNQNQKALESFGQACSLNPSVECHERLGEIYFRMRDWQNTIRELSAVERQGEQSAELYGILGTAFTRLGQTTEAVSMFQKGLPLAKDSKVAAQFHNNLGTLFLHLNRPDDSVKEFQIAIQRNWNNDEAHFGLARAYVLQNRFPEAKQSLGYALQLNPNHKEAKKLLKDVEKSLGR